MDQALESSAKLDYLSKQEKDKLLEVLLGDTAQGIVYCKPDSTIRMANQVFGSLLGLSMDKIIGSSMWSLFPDLQQLDSPMQKSRLTKKASDFKLKLPLADASPWLTYWKVTINPLFNGVEFSGWLLIFQQPPGRVLEDLRPAAENRDRKPTLIAKQHSEKILSALNEVLPFGYWECNPEGEVTAVSDAFLKTTGLSKEECVGLGWSVLLPDIEREHLIAGWRHCFQQQSGWTYEFWLRSSSGEYRAVTAHGFPVRDSGGAIRSWFVINFDTTAQYLKYEHQTKAATLWQQLFKAVVNHAPMGIALYSGEDVSLSWSNSHFRRFLELSEQAREDAGVVLENHLPYANNLRFDEVFYQALTNREAVLGLEVRFAQTPDLYWSCAVVPLTGLAEQNTDVIMIAAQFPAPVTSKSASETGADPEAVRPETPKQAVESSNTADNRQKTEEKQQMEAEFLKGLLETTSFGIAVVRGPENRFEHVNAYYRTVPEIAADVAGQRVVDVFPEATAEKITGIIQKISETGTPVKVVDHWVDQPVGLQNQYWEYEYLPFGDPGSETAGTIIIAANVTGREIHLKRVQQLNAIIQELNQGTNMADILRIATRLGVRTLKANDGGIYLFSVENGDYQVVYELWLEENVNRCVSIKEMPNLMKAVDTLKPHYFTSVEAEGREIDWFQDNGINGCLVIPLTLQQNCIGLLFQFYVSPELTISEAEKEFAALLADKCALVIDRAHTQLEKSRLLISERRARSRAERQAAEMSALLQSLKEGVLVLDATGNIVLRNRVERQISRVEDEQALSIIAYGRFRLLTPDGEPVPPQQLPGNRLLRGETINDTEYLMEHDDGTRLHVICNGSVVRGEDGQVVLGILVTRDITRVRELEEIREDLIRAVSHDLRNPLTVISARSQLLQRRMNKHGLTAEAEEAEVIYISAQRMTQMIQEMFDSYRLESDNFLLNKEYIDLDVVLRELSTRLGTEADRRRVKMEIAAGNYRLFADQERLERAIINLITNALKYSPEDKPVVVSLACQGERIYLSVTDWGIGIAPEDIPKVFQRYYRSTAVKSSTGLGLGLYIVKLIVEAHNGTVDVVSELNEGSTFRIILPKSAEESDSAGKCKTLQ